MAAAKIGDKIFAIRFKVDIYKGVKNGQYKDHAIVELEIEKSPFLYAGFDPYQQNSDLMIAIPEIREAFDRKSTTNISEKQTNSQEFSKGVIL
ncbi:hypothetical protein FACS1894121_0560 [Bacteroidia bacterium]|nr:hypothetical protein FACS1894121_0560 [Bacteroidia bacterium]